MYHFFLNENALDIMNVQMEVFLVRIVEGAGRKPLNSFLNYFENLAAIAF